MSEFDALSLEEKESLNHAWARAQSFSSDTRTLKENGVFVALKGQSLDAHLLVEDVQKKKPQCICVVRKDFDSRIPNLVRVRSTHLAHRYLAARARDSFPGLVVGIGGSSGKTSTKEFLSQILHSQYQVTSTEKSQNGDLGIPKTLESLDPKFDVAVIEIGIDAPGDMLRHANLVRPDVAVLSSIGEEHLNLLGTVENVFREESILFDVVEKQGGHCFAPEADAFLKRHKGRRNMHLVPPLDPKIDLPFSQNHMRQNAALAMAVALHIGVTEDNAKQKLSVATIPEGRGRQIDIPEARSTVIADYYNSNPSSLRAAMDHAAKLAREQGRVLVLVLGDMLDLGGQSDEEHSRILDDIKRYKPAALILVGPNFTKASRLGGIRGLDFLDAQTALGKIKSFPDSVVLLKGSRGMKMETILPALSRV